VLQWPLYYRLSEADKIAALKHNKGKFDATVCRDPSDPIMANTDIAMNMIVQQPIVLQKSKELLFLPNQPNEIHPYVLKALPIDMPLVGDQLKKQGFSDTASRVIQNSWRTGTKKQYACHIKRWICYCSKRDINPICPDVRDGINFLAELLDRVSCTVPSTLHDVHFHQ
jgi:hypothetical protein